MATPAVPRDTQERAAARGRGLAAWALVVAVAALVGWMVASSLDAVAYNSRSDDGYYLHYMSEVASRGPGAFPDLFRTYLGDERHWIYPSPSRVGFIAASALWSKVFGLSLASLSELSLASHLALILVSFAFARRWFGDFRAVLIATLIAFSPLCLGLSRLALMDSFTTLTQVAVLGLFFEYVREPERRLRWFGFVAAFTVAILTKEVAVLLCLPFVVHAAIERRQRGREVPIGRTLAALALPLVLSGVLWTFAAGGVRPFFEVLKIVLVSPNTNAYAIAYGSGAWYRYPIDEILMSPWPTLLGLAGIGVALWRRRRGEYDAVPFGFALVYVCQVAALGFFTKNLRYVELLETPLRVLAVLLLWDLCSAERKRAGRVLCAAAVAALCWLGYVDYREIWIRPRLSDPVTSELIFLRGMGPNDPAAR